MLYLTPDPWHLISDIGTWHVILDTWILTLDIWYRYLTCYHLTPDTRPWYMTLDNWHAITHLTCVHMVLVHLTWYCDTWLGTITPDTCITWHIHDYHFYGDLAWLLYCYQTSVIHKLLYSCTLELLYPLYSCPLHCYSVNSTVILASSKACLVSGWWGCIPRSY